MTVVIEIKAEPTIFLLNGSLISSEIKHVASYPEYAQNAPMIADMYAFGLLEVPENIFSYSMLNSATSCRHPEVIKEERPQPMITSKTITAMFNV